jgi:hypothetical protein
MAYIATATDTSTYALSVAETVLNINGTEVSVPRTLYYQSVDEITAQIADLQARLDAIAALSA